jgi:hypothetical protein
MSACIATLNYVPPPAIVLPVSERQNPFTHSRITVPETAQITTIEYGAFAPHFSKLRKLETDASLWPEGVDAPSTDSLVWARLVLQRFAEIGVAPSKVVASAEGGTAVCLVDGNRYADIESLNSGAILAVLSDKYSEPVVWDVEPNESGIALAIDRIRKFIYSP